MRSIADLEYMVYVYAGTMPREHHPLELSVGTSGQLTKLQRKSRTCVPAKTLTKITRILERNHSGLRSCAQHQSFLAAQF